MRSPFLAVNVVAIPPTPLRPLSFGWHQCPMNRNSHFSYHRPIGLREQAKGRGQHAQSFFSSRGEATQVAGLYLRVYSELANYVHTFSTN